MADKPEPNITDLLIVEEMQDSYLTYAMSVIMSRALPDARDGLKPSQRRILVAMNDLNLGPRSQHRKCAKIAGDTSGNYHPHGEQVIYPTLVREKRDREDDIHYSYLMDFDQLLELPTHKEYLRARRAWERRCAVKEVELNVTVQPGLRGPQTGRQLWSLAVALLMGFGFLSCLGQVGVGGLLSLPIWIGLWVAFTWLPLVYVGTFSGDGGRGASSSAI